MTTRSDIDCHDSEVVWTEFQLKRPRSSLLAISIFHQVNSSTHSVYSIKLEKV